MPSSQPLSYSARCSVGAPARSPSPLRRSSSSARRWRARLAFSAAIAAAYLGTASVAGATSSAEFYTPDGQGYGRYEARLMFPAGDGVVGSFFLWKDGSEMAGTYWNELDYEKINANCSLQINSFYGLPAVQHQQLVAGLSHLCDAYHTYAFEWTPDHIAWSIDGQELRRDTGAAAQAYSDNALSTGLQFRFSIWPGDTSFGGNFSTSILPVFEYISWVQYAAYTPGSGDVACDFTLAWRESFEQGVPSSWAEGNWASPKNLSTNTPLDVNVVNGIAVLSLTTDDMTGYSGTPPVDDGDLPSAMGPASMDASAPACEAGAPPSGDGGHVAAGPSSVAGGGCAVSASRGGARPWPVGAMLAMGGALLGVRRVLGRRRRRAKT